MFDWGGVWNDGYYTISFMTYKASGPFKLYSDFGIDDTVQGTGEWGYTDKPFCRSRKYLSTYHCG